jgi:hypothetical protein
VDNSPYSPSDSYACQLSGYLDLLVPEIDFGPITHYVQAIQLSCEETLIRSKPLSERMVSALRAERRHCQIQLDLTDRRVLTLRGRIVWMAIGAHSITLQVEHYTESDRLGGDVRSILAGLAASGTICSLAETNRSMVVPEPPVAGGVCEVPSVRECTVVAEVGFRRE